MFDSEIIPENEQQNPLSSAASSVDDALPMPGATADVFDAEDGEEAMSNFFTPNRVQIVPESHEPEDGHEEAEEVDFFEVIARALVFGKSLDPDHIQADMKQCFADIPDHEASMQPDELLKLVEDHLSLKLNEQEQSELLGQIQGVHSAGGHTSEPISVADFELWWDSFFELETVDPFRAAVAEMEKSNVISPTSDFRGNWDLVQAVLLFYIAAMLPYRIGFSHDVVLWSAWFWLDLGIDIYFLFDLCLNFRTAVITSDGELLYKKADIGEWACLRALRDHLQQKTAALGVALALTVSRGARSEILRQGMAAGGLRQLSALRLHPLRPRRGRGRGRKQGNAYAEDVSLAEAASPGSDQADPGSVGGGDVWRAATQDWQNRLRGRCNGALGSLRLVLGWCGHHTRRREFLHAAEWRHDRWLGGA
jgi:hypothetical protein